MASFGLALRSRAGDPGPCSAITPKGPGLNSDPGPTFRKQGIDQAGNLMPPLRASFIRRVRSDAFSPSVAVFRFTPAASYMR